MRSTSGMSVLSHGTRSRIAASNAMSVKSSIVMPIVAAGQEVSVLPRPLTAAGGISLSNKKSNAILSFNDEKISNSQYFAAFISKKEKEIVDEIQRLKNDTKIIEANILANSAKQKTYNTLLSDVKKLQETIADYNLAMENETNGCDLEELEDQVIKLKERNQGLVNEIDNVFIRAKRLEEEAKRIEEEKVIINKKIQLVLDSSDRESNIKYRRLNAQLEEVHQFKNYLHSEIKTLQESLKDMQTKLEQRNNKDLLDRIDKLEEEIASRMRDLETINEKLFVAQMSPEEAKSYLLEKVKGNKANEVKIDEEIATVQDKLQRLEAEESRLMKTICDAEPPEISNCKAIWEQKKSADDFLAASNNTVNTLKAENENMAKNIATLREVLKEKTIDHADNNKMNAKSLHDTINYKSKNLNNSKWTISQLLDQKLTRTEELEKVRNIKDKIQKEYQQLEVEMDKMKQKIDQYEDLQTIELESERIKTSMLQMKERFIEHEEAFLSDIKNISDEYNKNKEYIDNSTTWKSMEKYEDMIARQCQVNFELQEELNLKRRLTDYESTKTECFKLINELSKLPVPKSDRAIENF